MGREWTKEQHEAIYARNADLLVAAAAGSGKTAVLVERIIQRITDKQQPVDLDRLLVVTFTNAAAAEMRQRIGEALEDKLEQEPDNTLLRHQLVLLPKASVTTIHAYCHRVLRSHFDALGLDPGFRVADPTEIELLRAAALDEVIEAMYEDADFAEDFLALTESYMQIKNPEPFYALINHIYDFAMSLPNPEAWLKMSTEHFLAVDDFDETIFAKTLVLNAKKQVEAILRQYDAMLYLADRDDGGEVLIPFLHNEKEAFAKLLTAENYTMFRDYLCSMKLETIPRAPKHSQPRYREIIRDIRTEIKGMEFKSLREDIFVLSSQEQQEIMRKLYPLMNCLSELVRRLMACFAEKKEKKNVLDYNDLEQGCYRLFVDKNGQPTALAKAEKDRFDEILIDEYQDTSALQEAIFAVIKKEKGLFLVGDLKQSIYRFRNTNPKLFRDKKERYSLHPDAAERKIILSKNFRSRASVLDGINYIFSQLMSDEVGDVSYNAEEMLYPGLDYPPAEHPLSAEIELYMAELDSDGEALEATEAEAIMAAKRITELMEGQYQVLGKQGMRKLRYGDICILMRSTKNTAPIFCKTLADCGIPCFSDAGSSFLQSREITVMMSLLKIIDNPHQDIPLLAVLHSELYGLTPDELAEIRLADRKSDIFDAVCARATQQDGLGARLKDFLDRLSLYREKSRELDTAELVWYLYAQTGLYDMQAVMRGGTLRRMNLRLLYLRAAEFEKTGLKGLYSFIRFIDEYESIGGDYDAARAVGEEQDVVRVMSIHKSKGLEFPVVIVSGLDRRFNMRDTYEKVLIHDEFGYGPKYIDTDLGISYENAASQAVKQAMKAETISEEMRILYVALTRAREKLILTGAGKDIAFVVQECALGVYNGKVSAGFAQTASSYLDWILMALFSHPDGAALRDRVDMEFGNLAERLGRFRIELYQEEELIPETVQRLEEEKNPQKDLSEQLMSQIDYQYAFADSLAFPAKITVTELKRKMQEQEEDAVYLYPRPLFLMKHKGGLKATEIGTAVHSFMERLDYRRCQSEAELLEQLNELESQNILSREEAAAIPILKIKRFVDSPIGKRLQAAEKVRREVSFSFYMDAEPFFGAKGQVMLQGMIDCVLFEEDGISIIDYKTDRGESPAELVERYKLQLDCYAKAAEIMYGKPVIHRYLYLFHFDDYIEV
ncbi:MAG: helicase-exonuclease AddAB subunit AddA [Ruminococcaceae bacterium]|nr:helicase-exonuclease AddAB subunit AddA [Oscillospiraceae bacterium]